MRFILVVLVWCVLFAVAWPLALLVLIALPILWLLSIPFRLFGMILEAALAFIKALLFLPARVLGHKSS